MGTPFNITRVTTLPELAASYVTHRASALNFAPLCDAQNVAADWVESRDMVDCSVCARLWDDAMEAASDCEGTLRTVIFGDPNHLDHLREDRQFASAPR